MVYRVFAEKKKELANEAKALKNDIKSFLQIGGIEDVRIVNRYDAENISPELFEYCKKTVFAEPQLDIVSDEVEIKDASCVFAAEYLPGQFDQRANSAAECIQLISKGERPIVKTAKIYLLYGSLTNEEINEIKKYVINPVEAREASLDSFDTLKVNYDVPEEVKTLNGFISLNRRQLEEFITENGLAMDADDIEFCQKYFISEKRDPTITEIKMIDTYWSDHCRHTTFLTTIDSVSFEDELIQKAYDEYLAVRDELGRTKPVNLMDIATVAVKYLRKNGKLDKLDESEEINACTVKIDVEMDGKKENWLLMFKNETHNHPTEIEPFGGAATCIGGAIRDPLSGRGYVYAAMRVTGAANPLKPVSETMNGKLPQRKIVTTAANGYSSYGNQIGLATGIVDEIYHDGYAAKRMEIGAVIAAAPSENVRRERPVPGDVVILLGGKTGRDGCGGATGSSKSHTLQSLESCGAEVQKGNAPEERKLQRLFRNPKASKLIKRCNDFGAGGVSVAVGELADGLAVDLNAVPKKYEGLDGTELAISESQERMAVVVAKDDAEEFCRLANSENIEATKIADIQEKPYFVMNWNGKSIVNVSREFLNSNGAPKHIDVKVKKAEKFSKDISGDFKKNMEALAGDLNVCSKRGLSERFDSTIGSGTVLMPFGGKYQRTPIQAMVNKISSENKHTDDCSVMAWGYNPFITEKSPYHGAYLAVTESVSKLVAAGASFEDVYLTFQEYFEKPKTDPERWGKPAAALLGAFKAQLDFEIGSIGGKDSMSGSFENIDVPPTLVSFAVTTDKAKNIISPEFKNSGHRVIMLKPDYDESGLPCVKSQKKVFARVTELIRSGSAVAAYTPTYGGIAEAVLKMSMGNGIGFDFNGDLSLDDIFGYNYGAFILEICDDTAEGVYIGSTTEKCEFCYKGKRLDADGIFDIYESVLEKVYKCNIETEKTPVQTFSYSASDRISAAVKTSRPKVLIPVFPGTNCEYDTAKAVDDAGAEAEIFVVNNLSAQSIARSVDDFADKIRESQVIFIPGGFSGGDEPEGSAKMIAAFFRNDAVKDAVSELMDKRGGLMCGICNGFQALIKLGLVPYGKITDIDESSPTLTFNTIGRHQSKLVRTVVSSNKSPWLANTNPGEVYTVPVSHGEGRFIASENLIKKLAESGQIATQYADLSGNPTYDVQFNPNGSVYAIEGITSPDGRIFGKMGHTERYSDGLYKNVEGNYNMGIFDACVKFFK